MASVDISIRGAGILGLSIAWECVRRGARIELVDPHGVGAGASGGIVGALAPHVPENWNAKKQFQFESLLMARRFWPEIEEATQLSTGYCTPGRIQPLEPRAVDLAQARAITARDHWADHAIWQVQPSGMGWAIDSSSGMFVFDSLSAHIHPRKTCTALAEALRAFGVTVRAESTMPNARTIWATGANGLEELSAQHCRSVGQGIKGQAALLDLDCAGLPQLFVDSLHVIPHVDGTVAIGSTTEREFEHPVKTDQQLDDLLERATRAVPALAGATVLERWAGLRPRARSRAPMLGQWPQRADHFIANGGFKIGLGMAPKIAHVMADLVLEGVDAIPDDFRVEASY